MPQAIELCRKYTAITGSADGTAIATFPGAKEGCPNWQVSNRLPDCVPTVRELRSVNDPAAYRADA
ncbi:hypothetical protein [Myxacorys almedinensis]|uniref:Uncharacterized protein n=1 Tax=Myxacorys almedinensis A TaxID=2690445 RepID=A0A8J7YZE2_9CYAN|nr:hypothetical protein [Myxacorys almedinensis]NDJ16869.1 hypothetical protein [Myxacorys almedinensis A]